VPRPHPAAQTAYGLTLLSDEPLPGLAPAPPGAAADVRVRLRAMPAWLTPGTLAGAREWRPAALDADAPLRIHRTGEGWFHLAYADGTRVAVDGGGTEVWADWPEGVMLDATATYLVGPVLGWILRLRGVLALHASVAAVDGAAVALAGAAGMGKSTAAAALARAGWAVLSDDVAALDEEGGAFSARPAFPRVRLWEDAVEALFGAPDSLPRVCAGWEKRYLPLDDLDAFGTRSAPLAAVFLLDDARPEGAAAEPVARAEALRALLPHTYAGALLDARMRGRELEALSRLVSRVPVFRLHLPDGAARMGEVAPVIAAELARLRAARKE
jgi:hypothetical protein